MFLMFFYNHLPKENMVSNSLVIIQLLVIRVESIPFIFTHLPILGNPHVNVRLQISCNCIPLHYRHHVCSKVHQQFCVTCSKCLHLMSTNTSWCSQFPCYHNVSLDVDPCPTHPPPMATKFLANFEKLVILLLWVPTMAMNIAMMI